jgi:hypothetical protein
LFIEDGLDAADDGWTCVVQQPDTWTSRQVARR